MTPRPLSECTLDDVVENHALVFGRTMMYHTHTDGRVQRFFTETKWWKALYYPHRGAPNQQCAWGVYAGCGGGFTGPGDAELTHFIRMPENPT